MPRFTCFEDIDSWQKGRSLVNQIYELSKTGRFTKDFALRDQVRRASISIIANIAEGFERGSNNEFIYFLSIAKGSAGEVRSLLYVELDQKYITREEFQAISDLTRQIINMTSGLIHYLKRSHLRGTRKK